MSKDIKKALEHCVEWKCDNCPNRDELGSGEIVCRGRLLPEVLEYVADLEAKLAESEEKCKKAYQEGLLQKQFDKDMEIEQLKQQLHDLSKKIVGEIKKELYDCGKTYLEDEPYIEICIVQGILNTILKKYGGQDG